MRLSRTVCLIQKWQLNQAVLSSHRDGRPRCAGNLRTAERLALAHGTERVVVWRSRFGAVVAAGNNQTEKEYVFVVVCFAHGIFFLDQIFVEEIMGREELLRLYREHILPRPQRSRRAGRRMQCDSECTAMQGIRIRFALPLRGFCVHNRTKCFCLMNTEKVGFIADQAASRSRFRQSRCLHITSHPPHEPYRAPLPLLLPPLLLWSGIHSKCLTPNTNMADGQDPRPRR